MKIYLTPPQPSLGLERIATALRKYAPPPVTIHTFPNISNNDLTIIYAIGRRDAIERQCEKILKAGKRYAIIQICLRSTMSPTTHSWVSIWERASVVWSYYDLQKAMEDDCVRPELAFKLRNFYHAPLGADADVFYPRPHDKVFTVVSTGLSRLSESVRECHLAAQQVGGSGVHLGQQLQGILSYSDMTDNEVANLYSASHFVSGLRRKEGFELPAVEGLLCGSRPILFNCSDYRHWYEPWGEFIEETDRQGVVDQLVELFKRGARPVTVEEREAAVERFNWKTIVEGFYERLL